MTPGATRRRHSTWTASYRHTGLSTTNAWRAIVPAERDIRLFPMAAMPDSVLTRQFLEAEVFKASLAEDSRPEPPAAPATAMRTPAADDGPTDVDRAGETHGRGGDRSEALAQQRAVLGRVWLKSDVAGLAQDTLKCVLEPTRKLLQQQGPPAGLSPRETIVAELLLKGLAEAASAADVQRLLPPAMLYLSPLRLDGLRYEVPGWLREDFFRYQLARPSYFEKPGEVDAYRDYLLRLTEAVHAEIRRRPAIVRIVPEGLGISEFR